MDFKEKIRWHLLCCLTSNALSFVCGILSVWLCLPSSFNQIACPEAAWEETVSLYYSFSCFLCSSQRQLTLIMPSTDLPLCPNTWSLPNPFVHTCTLLPILGDDRFAPSPAFANFFPNTTSSPE